MRFFTTLLLCAAALHAADPADLVRKGLREIENRHGIQGERHIREALDKWEKEPAPHPPEYALALVTIADILQGRGDFEHEDQRLEQARQAFAESTPAEDATYALFLELRGMSLDRNGKPDEATEVRTRAAAIRGRLVAALFPDPPFDPAQQPIPIRSADRKPVPIQKPDPPFSIPAQLAKIGGTSAFSIVIDENGLPRRIRLIRSLGFGLDENGARSVHEWRFSPAIKNGQPVKVTATVEVNFHIVNNR